MTVRIILKQLLWAIGLWFLIAAVCFSLGSLGPRIYPTLRWLWCGWYFSVPILFAVVSWFRQPTQQECAGA